MPTVDINGITLEYAEQGSGETVIFVHGSLSDYRIWQRQQDEFSKDYRTISYSRRYHWPNESISEGADYSMPEHLDDLEAVIKALAPEPTHLIGHSYGAFLALLLAIRSPHLIRSMVLAEPPAVTLFMSIPPKPHHILKLLITRPRTAIAIIKLVATGLIPATKAIEHDDIEKGIQIFGHASLGRKTFEQLSESDRDQIAANFVKAEFLGSGFSPVDPDNVRQIQLPVLLMNGQNSPPFFHRIIDRLYELLPYTERIEIPNASHRIQIDNPEEYNNAVLTFLNRHKQIK